MRERKHLKDTIRWGVTFWAISAVCLGAISTVRAGATVSFQGVGDLPGGNFKSVAYGVSGDGSTVVGQSWSGFGWEAFKRTSSGIVPLGDLPGAGFSSNAYAASYDGSVIVGVSNYISGTGEAFRWTSGGAMVGLGALSDIFPSSAAYDVSADGSVVVGRSISDTTFTDKAFRWTSGGGMVDLSATFYGEAHGVSDDGSTITGFRMSPSIETFAWTAGGGMVGLGGLSTTNASSQGEAISADGSTIVGQGNQWAGPEAFRWTLADGMTGLGDLAGGSFHSHAYDVSGNGSVVVGNSWSAAEFREAFVWDPINGMRGLKGVLVNDYGLDLTGWTLYGAYGVSDDGQTIVGNGTNPGGDPEGWIVTIPAPEFAIGYDYSIVGSNFASVLLPGAGDDLFDLYLWDGASFVFAQELAAGAEFTFAAGGVDRFRIRGIEESAWLDPNDPLAFVPDFTYIDPGSDGFTSIAYVPEPASLSLLTIGLVGLLRRRRR